jgi:phosphatidylserine decarboxylase
MARSIVYRALGGSLVLVFVLTSGCGVGVKPTPDAQGLTGSACPKPERQPATRELMELVATNADLKQSLEESIALGQKINDDPFTNPVADLEGYYGFIDALVTYDPRNIPSGAKHGQMSIRMDGERYCNWNILDLLSYSYFLVDRQLTTDPRGQIQYANQAFSDWMRRIAESWGEYLETPDSARYVPEFKNDPSFGDWYCPKAPYATFQDFFVRELCATAFPTGSRPVEGLADSRTVVSVADSNTMGTWPIDANGRLVTGYDRVSQAGSQIKGKLYSDIHEFVAGGPGETVLAGFGELDPAIFDGGTFSHQFLNVNNYHRLHVPVAGKLVYMRHFQSGTRMKSGWKPKVDESDVAYYDPRDTPDWQFGQTRLVLGIETLDHGVVVAAPMGMAQVAAIQLRAWVEQGVEAEKGWEFANFAFGGSDFVVLFERDADFVLTVPHSPEVSPGAGVNYQPSLQGQRYGCFGGSADCGTASALPASYPGFQ